MKTTQSIEINLIDVCLPDYFRGSHNPCLHVYPDKATTVRELLDMVADEVRMIGDHIEYTFEVNGYTFSYDMLDKAVEFIKQINEQDNRMDLIALPDLEYAYEDMDDDERDNFEGCQAIFEVRPIVDDE
jgi:hypothetical protein